MHTNYVYWYVDCVFEYIDCRVLYSILYNPQYTLQSIYLNTQSIYQPVYIINIYSLHLYSGARYTKHYPTFLFSKFVCIWLLILDARIQSLKESWVVAMESFSIEHIEAILRKCSKGRYFRNIGGTCKKIPTPKYNIR